MWTRERRIFYPCFGLLVLLLVLCYFWLADPQSCKYIYRFQARVGFWLGKRDRPELAPPYQYTGAWTFWFANGRKSEIYFERGQFKGKATFWDSNGELKRIDFFAEPSYLTTEWLVRTLVARGIIYNKKRRFGSFVDRVQDPSGVPPNSITTLTTTLLPKKTTIYGKKNRAESTPSCANTPTLNTKTCILRLLSLCDEVFPEKQIKYKSHLTSGISILL